jgi:hypothetical protein
MFTSFPAKIRSADCIALMRTPQRRATPIEIEIDIEKLPEIDFDHDFDFDINTELPWFEDKIALGARTGLICPQEIF